MQIQGWRHHTLAVPSEEFGSSRPAPYPLTAADRALARMKKSTRSPTYSHLRFKEVIFPSPRLSSKSSLKLKSISLSPIDSPPSPVIAIPSSGVMWAPRAEDNMIIDESHPESTSPFLSTNVAKSGTSEEELIDCPITVPPRPAFLPTDSQSNNWSSYDSRPFSAEEERASSSSLLALEDDLTPPSSAVFIKAFEEGRSAAQAASALPPPEATDNVILTDSQSEVSTTPAASESASPALDADPVSLVPDIPVNSSSSAEDSFTSLEDVLLGKGVGPDELQNMIDMIFITLNGNSGESGTVALPSTDAEA
ncbi:hypothetical protein JCM6882_000539 [Rhodosporidiobolus microsporus]